MRRFYVKSDVKQDQFVNCGKANSACSVAKPITLYSQLQNLKCSAIVCVSISFKNLFKSFYKPVYLQKIREIRSIIIVSRLQVFMSYQLCSLGTMDVYVLNIDPF